jgi:hypothetical protein
MEIWKDINGYEGYYQISSYGRVKNVETNKILIGDTNNIGYRRVWLYIPVKKRYFVHRLVAIHFCRGYRDGFVVNHKDGDKLNNHADNLEWVTRSENDLHAYRLNLREPHPCQFKHRILAYDVKTGELVKIYNNTMECSEDLNVARPNIYNCCNGKQASCRGYILRYE